MSDFRKLNSNTTTRAALGSVVDLSLQIPPFLAGPFRSRLFDRIACASRLGGVVCFAIVEDGSEQWVGLQAGMTRVGRDLNALGAVIVDNILGFSVIKLDVSSFN